MVEKPHEVSFSVQTIASVTGNSTFILSPWRRVFVGHPFSSILGDEGFFSSMWSGMCSSVFVGFPPRDSEPSSLDEEGWCLLFLRLVSGMKSGSSSES